MTEEDFNQRLRVLVEQAVPDMSPQVILVALETMRFEVQCSFFLLLAQAAFKEKSHNE